MQNDLTFTLRCNNLKPCYFKVTANGIMLDDVRKWTGFQPSAANSKKRLSSRLASNFTCC